MSLRLVVVALVLAILLGLVAFLLTRTGEPAGGPAIPAGEILVRMPPSAVQWIEVIPPSGVVQTLVQNPGTAGGGPAGWSLRIGDDGTDWPVVSTQVGSFLRYVTGTRSLGSPSGDDTDTGTSVRFHVESGEVVTLAFAARQLGGQVVARIKRPAEDGQHAERIALIDDDLLRALTPPSGPPSWRATEAIRMVPADVSRVTLANEQGRLMVARTGRSWRLLLPVAAPAEDAAVERLLRSAGALRITDFLDGGVPASRDTGLDQPVATLIVEADRRQVGDDDQIVVSAEARDVMIGGPADASGVHLFAKIGPEGAVVVIDASTLSALTVAPEPYVRRAPIGSAPAEVVGLRLAPPLAAGAPVGDATEGERPAWLHYERTLEGWAQFQDDREPSLLDADTRTAIDGLVGYLAEGGRIDVQLAAPEGYEPMASLRVNGLAGDRIDDIEIGVAGTDESQMVVLRSGGVYRTETGELPAFFARLLEEALLRRSSAVPVAPGPVDREGPEVFK